MVYIDNQTRDQHVGLTRTCFVDTSFVPTTTCIKVSEAFSIYPNLSMLAYRMSSDAKMHGLRLEKKVFGFVIRPARICARARQAGDTTTSSFELMDNFFLGLSQIDDPRCQIRTIYGRSCPWLCLAIANDYEEGSVIDETLLKKVEEFMAPLQEKARWFLLDPTDDFCK